MSAQTVTPVLLGLIFMNTSAWGALPVYSSALIFMSALVFIFMVKNIRARKASNHTGLEALGEEN